MLMSSERRVCVVYFFRHTMLARVNESGLAILEVACEGSGEKCCCQNNQKPSLDFFLLFPILDHIYKL